MTRDEILKETLKDPKCYDTHRATRGRLKMRYVNEQLQMAKEALFYDEAYFPYLARLTKKAKAWGIFETEWQTTEMGYHREITIDYPIEDDAQILIGDHMQWTLEVVWYGPDWSWPEPTVQECISLVDIAENYQLAQQAFQMEEL